MKLSIITINYNDANGLKKTMDSVLSQTYDDFEYIVVDGASEDGSVAVLESYNAPNLNWISESDSGIYNAMNKGIHLAKGDYLLFLNSGDFLVEKEVLKRITSKFNENYSFIGCSLFLETKRGRRLREHPEKISFSYMVSNTLSHPSTFIKRGMFECYGLYNEANKIISDWEFFFKALALNGESFFKIKDVLTVFDMDGISSNPNNNELIQSEREAVLKRYLKGVYNNDLDLFIFNHFKRPTKRIKYLMKIEKSPFLRKLTTAFLAIISKLAR